MASDGRIDRDGGDTGADGPDDADGTPVRARTTLTGISSRAWEHPADRGALVALRGLRGFDEVLRRFSGMFDERAYRLRYLGSAIRVDHRQYSRVHRLFAEAGTALDVAELPELYVELNASPNGRTLGLDRPFIVVTSAAVELLDESELRFLLGHELGHLGSGHAVYRTMLDVLLRLVDGLGWLPVGALALRGIVAALHEWSRKAELSADRAGLLAGQDPAAALRTAMKLAGGGNLADIDTAAFLEQAAEYDRAGDLRDSLIKLMLLERASHPFPVARAAELRRWVDEGEYSRILAGDYPRRADDAQASMSDEVRAAANSYREAFAHSQDPLAGLLRRLADTGAGLGGFLGGGADRAWRWATRGERPPADDDQATANGSASG